MLTLLVGRQEGYPACKKTGCWFVDGDGLTRSLRDLQFQLSPTPALPLAAMKFRRMETFWYGHPGPPGKWPLKRRVGGRERERKGERGERERERDEQTDIEILLCT